MPLISLKCTQCEKVFLRSLGHANETIRLGRKPYCSIKCVGVVKTLNNIEVKCENPGCMKVLKRSPGQISPHNYCSHSCSVKIANSQREKKTKFCLACNTEFTGHKKYCSLKCIPRRESQYNKQIILSEIQKFAQENSRIPTKKELNKIYRMTRELFGTWNNAIKAAGLKPNPVMFANKHIALDGHKCDSLAERIIDDWFYRRNISHKRSVAYPGRLGLKTDFLVGDYWIEFFGLSGEHRRYDELKKKKLDLVRRNKIKLVKIYPKHLFPKGKLDEFLGFLV